MYTELDTIRNISDRPTKSRLISMFIEEYGGWLQHLNTVGLKWGAGGEETGANREAVITRNHLNELHDELLKLTIMKEDITKSYHFGAKVKFTYPEQVHQDLRNKEFCLIGFDESAFALIEWEKRGQYQIEFYTGNIYEKLSLCE